MQSDSIDYIDYILEEIGFDTSNLKLEINETLLMGNADHVTRLILKLMSLGIQVFLDDFGSGYSSLKQLSILPIDTIKLDYSLISRMLVDADVLLIVECIISLATNLDIKVVAEGVETEEHLKKLRELGCEFGQGFYFCEPINKEGAYTLIESNPKW